MPDTYVVTTPATTVTLASAPRVGQVAFTVSNIAGRPMRTRLRIVPQEPAQPGWFVIDGGEERLLGLGATETFAVAVSVPPEVPAGSVTFRADAVGEDSPDEDFQTGPTVSLTVPAAVEKAKFPWWIVAVAAAVIVLGVGVFVLISRSGGDAEPIPTDEPVATVVLPDVKGLPVSQARAALEALGLAVETAIIDTVPATVACDRPVLIAIPGASQTVDVGSTVTLGLAQMAPTSKCFVKGNPDLFYTNLLTNKYDLNTYNFPKLAS